MRKSFNGLSGLVRNEPGKEPTSGEVFIFLNKNRLCISVWLTDKRESDSSPMSAS